MLGFFVARSNHISMVYMSQNTNTLISRALVFAIACAFVGSGFLPQTVDANTQNVVASPLSVAAQQQTKYGRKAAGRLTFPEVEEREVVQVRYMDMTAYNSLPAQTNGDPCVTANGDNVCMLYEQYGYQNTVASNAFPFGTLLRFPDLYGDKVFRVNDRMARRYRNRVDFWMASYPEARQFGVKRGVKVEVVAFGQR